MFVVMSLLLLKCKTLYLPPTWTNESLWPPPPEPMRGLDLRPATLTETGLSAPVTSASRGRFWNVEAGGCSSVEKCEGVRMRMLVIVRLHCNQCPEHPWGHHIIIILWWPSHHHIIIILWWPLMAASLSLLVLLVTLRTGRKFNKVKRTLTKRYLRGRGCQPSVSEDEECHSRSDK